MTADGSHLLAGMGTGLCGGLLSGLFGIGGGIVMVPLLGLILGLDQHRAQGATLAAMLLPTGLPAVLEYRRRGITTSLPLVAVLVLAFLFGVTGGSFLANLIPPGPLRWGYASFLVLLAIRTFLRQDPPVVDRGTSPVELAGLWNWGLPIGFLAGLLSGLTGLGGAVVVIPLLASRFRMTQHEAQLTSLMMMLPPIGLPGVYVYARAQGGLPWLVIGGVAVGFAVGALGGARMATRLRGPRLKQVYAAFVLLMALLVVCRHP
ncbi:MAG: sulfite exporter TauE/SafE family protein [Geothrix sp.]|uniref:sulfite exporter TauE/SafE family protein n=1 Tax=Geothrix sp. TaxID=1962974 RepID=UPI0017FC35EE|nr:sulfite exporter TauE/SafE family protein [Geothrix sp.]NWJ41172.1 sulfite exporter TauE/SafE family protein [Geothrix sp.]WIL20837.1 MAG: sulfite exporter TauE/SafE family protein [Geothrix sp.]